MPGGSGSAASASLARLPRRPSRVAVVITVLIADDQALVRAGFRALLDAEADITVVGEAVDGDEAVRLAVHAAARRRADGRAHARDRRARRHASGSPATTASAARRSIILTTFDLDEYVFEAIRAGANGFLVKDTEPAELVRAVRAVVDGDALLSPRDHPAADRGVRHPRQGAAAGRPTSSVLTDREREVVGLVAEGLTNDEIADAADHERGDGPHPRQPGDDQGRRARPGPARRVRLRDRTRPSRLAALTAHLRRGDVGRSPSQRRTTSIADRADRGRHDHEHRPPCRCTASPSATADRTVVDELDLELPQRRRRRLRRTERRRQDHHDGHAARTRAPARRRRHRARRPASTTRPSYLPRVGAMIESPAFYPALTGRENLRMFATVGRHPPEAASRRCSTSSASASAATTATAPTRWA